MMTVELTTDPTLTVGRPRVLFEGRYANVGDAARNYDVRADGQRLLMLKASEEQAVTQVNVVLNWTEELKRHTPTK